MNAKIVLAMCAWDSVKPSTAMQLIRLSTCGVFKAVMFSHGALLPKNRNLIVHNIFAHNTDFTHVLFVDADVNDIPPDLIQMLVEANKPIISPVTTQRKIPFAPHMYPEDIDQLVKQMEKPQEAREIIKVKGIGFGCTLIKREVLENTAEQTESGPIWFDMDRIPREDLDKEANLKLELLAAEEKTPEEYFKAGLIMGLTAHVGTNFIGEDYKFCIRAKRAGYDTFVHTGLYIGHIGEQTYDIRDWVEWINRKGEVTTNSEQKVSAWELDIDLKQPQRIIA